MPPQGIILHCLVSHTPAPLETNLCSDNYEKLEPSALHGGRISGKLSFVNPNAHYRLGINRLSREMHGHRRGLCHQERVDGLVCPRGATTSSLGPAAQPQQCLGSPFSACPNQSAQIGHLILLGASHCPLSLWSVPASPPLSARAASHSSTPSIKSAPSLPFTSIHLFQSCDSLKKAAQNVQLLTPSTCACHFT